MSEPLGDDDKTTSSNKKEVMPEPIGPAGPGSRPRRGGNSSQDEETTRGYLKPLASGINETSSVKKKAPVQFLVYADDSGEDEDECEAEEEEQKAKRRPSTRGGSSRKKVAASSSPAVTVTVVEESPDEDPPAMAKAGFIFVQHLCGFSASFAIWRFAFCPRLDKCHRRSQIFPVAFRRF